MLENYFMLCSSFLHTMNVPQPIVRSSSFILSEMSVNKASAGQCITFYHRVLQHISLLIPFRHVESIHG